MRDSSSSSSGGAATDRVSLVVQHIGMFGLRRLVADAALPLIHVRKAVPRLRHVLQAGAASPAGRRVRKH